MKWLKSVTVMEEPFTGPFERLDYRLIGEDGRSERLTTLPVHSLISSLARNDRVRPGRHVLRGIAWGGEGGIARVEVSVDGGAWVEARLEATSGCFGRTHWSFVWEARLGLRAVAVRATDGDGRSQPGDPVWNRGGYANSSIQRVRVVVE